MATEALVYAYTYGHPLGAVLTLNWTFPTTLPDAYEVHSIRKVGSAPTDPEIALYQADPDNPPDGIKAEVMTSNLDGTAVDGIIDFQVADGTTYHYDVFILDTGTDEWSAKTSTSGTPAFTATTNMPDAKEHAIQAVKYVLGLERYGPMLDDRDYNILRDHNYEPVDILTIVVTRSPGMIISRNVGGVLGVNPETGEELTGDHEMDNIHVVWMDPSAERRDKITNIFREAKPAIKLYMNKQEGITFTDVSIEGDAINPMFRDRAQPTGSMSLRCQILSSTSAAEDSAPFVGSTESPITT